MTTPNDILTHIITGRFLTERTRADHLARVLSEVEDLVREMRPTSEAVTIEGGNTADLADLEEMRGIIEGAGYRPIPAGLRGLVEDLGQLQGETEAARGRLVYILSVDPNATLAELVSTAGEALDDLHREKDKAVEALKGARADVFAAEKMRDKWHREFSDERLKRDALTAQNAALRAQIAALTPGPWRTVAEEEPPRGVPILTVSQNGYVHSSLLSEREPIDWMRLWRPLPDGLLDVPALAVAPANAQPEGAR